MGYSKVALQDRFFTMMGQIIRGRLRDQVDEMNRVNIFSQNLLVLSLVDRCNTLINMFRSKMSGASWKKDAIPFSRISQPTMVTTLF